MHVKFKKLIPINKSKLTNLALIPDEDNEPVMLVSDDNITYEFPLCTAEQIHVCNQFLRSLKLSIDIKFQNYKQYSELLDHIFSKINEQQKVTI